MKLPADMPPPDIDAYRQPDYKIGHVAARRLAADVFSRPGTQSEQELRGSDRLRREPASETRP